jgi:hypothetical protein
MTTTSVRSVPWLLEQLEDPFTIFPVEDVADTLFQAVDETEARKAEHTDPWWGVNRKFWSVEQEHYHEKIGLLIGAMFVLGQAAITQTVSILNELSKHPQAEGVVPSNKTRKLVAHAATEAKTNLSKIVIINAVSNYFKHVYEWPEQWDVATTSGTQAETISIVLQLGMRPEKGPADNLLHAADCLGLHRSDPRALARCIQEWREGWARMLYASFMLMDPFTASPPS